MLSVDRQKFVRLDGSGVEVEIAALPTVYREKSAMQIVARDISEQKKLQTNFFKHKRYRVSGPWPAALRMTLTIYSVSSCLLFSPRQEQGISG